MNEAPSSKQKLKAGDIRKAWLGSGFTRTAVVLEYDERDGFAKVRYPEYPHLGIDWVREDDLS